MIVVVGPDLEREMSRREESIWPLLCILACLFVLSAVAPPSWESVARSEPADEYLSRISASPMRSVVGIAAHRPAKAAAGAALAKIPPAVTEPWTGAHETTGRDAHV